MRGRALVAWNLRQIRVNRGLSQKKLAFDAGIDRSYVGGLERQEENPTVDLLDRLAKALSSRPEERPAGPILYPAPELPDDTPIENVRFSTRIRNAVTAVGWKTVGEIREASDATLLGLPQRRIDRGAAYVLEKRNPVDDQSNWNPDVVEDIEARNGLYGDGQQSRCGRGADAIA